MFKSNLIPTSKEKNLFFVAAVAALTFGLIGNIFAASLYDYISLITGNSLLIKSLLLFDSGLGFLIIIFWLSSKIKSVYKN